MHRISLALALALGGLLATGPSRADLVETLTARPRPGLWEFTVHGAKEPRRVCITEQTRAQGLRQSLESFRKLGCRTTREAARGDDYEIQLACNLPQPGFGNFEVLLSGTVRADYLRTSSRITGGGALVQQMTPDGMAAPDEWRWQRPCLPGEKPGIQERK